MAQQPAAGKANAVRDLLLGEDAGAQAQFVLNLIGEASEGKEVLNVISDVIQVTIAGGVGHPHVKKLAYDLCRGVPLLDADYGLLLDGIRNDVSSGMPELQVMALSFLPHLPPHLLVDFLDRGDVAALVVPQTRSITPSVRAAATSALGAILLQPDIQGALATTPAMAANSDEWWDAVTDGLADSMADVILSALTATIKLFEAAGTVTHAALAMRTNARRTALKVCLAMGPLVDTWRMLPSHAQVSVASLMGHIAATVVQLDPSNTEQSGTDADAAGLGGSISAALAGVVSYLSSALQSLNPAVKLEAARVLLRMSTATRRLPPLSPVRLASSVPPAVAASAISALLELKERLLVEAALGDIISLVAGHLDVLPVSMRTDVLRRLWPMIALLQSPTDRTTAFAAGWRTALDMHLQAAEAASKGLEAPEGMLLSSLLADPFVQDVVNRKGPAPHPTGSFASPGGLPPGAQGGGDAVRGGEGTTSGSGGGAPADAPANPAAAGPTGASAFDPAAAGPTGASAFDPAAAGPTGASSLNPAAAGPTGASSLNPAAAGPTGAGASTPRGGAAAALGVGTPFASDDGIPPSPAAGGTFQAAQQKLASGARSVGDTLTGAATSAADLVRSAGFNLPRFFEGPAAASRGQLPASLKHELVCSLLGVLAQHASAGLALQLPPGEPVELAPVPVAGSKDATKPEANGGAATPAANGAVPPQPGPPGISLSAPIAALPLQQQRLHPNAAAHGELQERAVVWLDAAVVALQATASCLQWEPLLPPPLPGQPPAPKLPAMEAVNLTTVPVDLWLQLLQGTCAASRAVLRAHGHSGLKSVYRANGGRMLARLTLFDASSALARALEASSIALQGMIQRALTGWRSLALAARPRVLWVAAHYLELPAMLEDTWACLLGCVEDTLLRVWRMEGDAHTRLLAASAREGVLFKRATILQLGGAAQGKGAQALFDAAAASSLVELPEYRSDGLQAREGGRGSMADLVALCVLQYLAWVVQANSRRKDGPAASGPAEAALARRLLDVVKAAGATEATGVDLKEWCRRISRALSAAADDAGLAHHTQTGAAAGLQFNVPPPPSQARGALPGGYNAVAGFHALGFGGGSSSSDDGGSSSSGSGAKAASSGTEDAFHGGDESSSSTDEDGSSSSSSSSSSSNNTGSGDEGSSSSGSASHGAPPPRAADTSSDDSDAAPPSAHGQPVEGGTKGGCGKSAAAAARAKRKAAKEKEKEDIARRNLVVGNPEASSGAWGYPFSGPRARTLFISRRSRRHRLMRWHLAAALAANCAGDAAEADASNALTLRAAGTTDDTGPVFSAGSGFRLDKRAFWDSLLPGSGATSSWVELTGPNDPLVLAGCYTLAKQGGAELIVTLRAYNRLPLDVEDVVVAVRLVGPVRPERREIGWVLPRLLPTEAATHQFKLLPTGYGRVELHARLVLPVGPEATVPPLRCRPLAVSMARMLRVPRGLLPGPAGFLEAWAGLPVGAELPVAAAWPGVDGLLLALSALARQPLRCAWRRALPAVCGAQAAYLSAPAAAPNEVVALVVTLQLMPPSSWDATTRTDARQPRGSDDGSAEDSDGAGADGEKDEDGPGKLSKPAGAGDRARGGSPPPPPPAEVARQLVRDMRVVGHVQLRSSSHEVVMAVRDHAAAWVQDLAQGTLVLGLTAPHVAPSDKPLLHPSVAQLQGVFQPAAPAVPLPPQVAEPEMPPPPKLHRRLKDKRDEEDSDAEDELAPLTEAEKEQRKQEFAKHRLDCRKVREKHREALAERAAVVLHRTALAEWKRLSGAL